MTAVQTFGAADTQYERLWNQHAARLKTHAKRLTRNNENAEDLFQDTAIKVYMNMEKMADEAKFLNWAMRIMQRIFLDKKRYDSRRPQTTSFDELNAHFGCEVEFEDPKVNVEAEVMLQEIQLMNSRQVRAMINSLAPTYSAALSLNTYGNTNSMDMDSLSLSAPMDYKSMAKASNSSVGTVRSRLNRAKKALALAARQSDFTPK